MGDNSEKSDRRLTPVDNSGIINKIIDYLPFEIHPPGYRFCGPGTHLAERVNRGERGVNALDDYCREHDIAYSNKDSESRTKADRLLAKRAFSRLLSETSSSNEKAVALLTTCCMLSKITFDTLHKCVKKKVKKQLPLLAFCKQASKTKKKKKNKKKHDGSRAESVIL